MPQSGLRRLVIGESETEFDIALMYIFGARARHRWDAAPFSELYPKRYNTALAKINIIKNKLNVKTLQDFVELDTETFEIKLEGHAHDLCKNIEMFHKFVTATFNDSPGNECYWLDSLYWKLEEQLKNRKEDQKELKEIQKYNETLRQENYDLKKNIKQLKLDNEGLNKNIKQLKLDNEGLRELKQHLTTWINNTMVNSTTNPISDRGGCYYDASEWCTQRVHGASSYPGMPHAGDPCDGAGQYPQLAMHYPTPPGCASSCPGTPCRSSPMQMMPGSAAALGPPGAGQYPQLATHCAAPPGCASSCPGTPCRSSPMQMMPPQSRYGCSPTKLMPGTAPGPPGLGYSCYRSPIRVWSSAAGGEEENSALEKLGVVETDGILSKIISFYADFVMPENKTSDNLTRRYEVSDEGREVLHSIENIFLECKMNKDQAIVLKKKVIAFMRSVVQAEEVCAYSQALDIEHKEEYDWESRDNAHEQTALWRFAEDQSMGDIPEFLREIARDSHELDMEGYVERLEHCLIHLRICIVGIDYGTTQKNIERFSFRTGQQTKRSCQDHTKYPSVLLERIDIEICIMNFLRQKLNLEKIWQSLLIHAKDGRAKNAEKIYIRLVSLIQKYESNFKLFCNILETEPNGIHVTMKDEYEHNLEKHKVHLKEIALKSFEFVRAFIEKRIYNLNKTRLLHDNNYNESQKFKEEYGKFLEQIGEFEDQFKDSCSMFDHIKPQLDENDQKRFQKRLDKMGKFLITEIQGKQIKFSS